MNDVSAQSTSIFKSLTIVFLVMNTAFLYVIYASGFGLDIGFLNSVTHFMMKDPVILLHVYGIAAFLFMSYLLMMVKRYGASLTFAVMPQFAFIGALGAVLL